MIKLVKNVLVLSLVVLLSGNLNASEFILDDARSILYRENVDLDAKSLKGWMRVFNSNSKLKEYEIFITLEEKERILLFLHKKYTEENSKYIKVVR